MPAKRRPPFEMEPGEGKAHEAAESPEEETREGSEEAEGENYPMKSRKRSARGAKRTKAPMDAEGGCCNAKKGKAPCAACATGKACGGAKADGDCDMKRGDALTPWEYLDACELGIQGRSRAYIRARLDAEQRLDAGVKCGGGYIAQGKKCKAGAGGAAPAGGGNAPKKGGGLKTLAKVAGAAALIGGAAYMAHTAGKAQRNAPVSKERQFMNAVANKAATAQVGREARAKAAQIEAKGKAALPQHVMNRQARVAAKAQVGREARAKAAQIQQKGQNSLLEHVMNRRAKAWKNRKDSVWATGFTPDSDLLAI